MKLNLSLSVYLLLVCALNVLAATIPHVKCPICDMSADDDHAFPFQGNQQVYGCIMGDEKVFGEKPSRYFLPVHDGENIETKTIEKKTRRDSLDKEDMKCPVCKMAVSTMDPYIPIHNGQKLFACSKEHAEELRESPLLYTPQVNNNSKFCIGSSVMLNGFAFSSDTCVTLLLDSWVLDTRWKLILAHIGVFFLALFHETVSYCRRRIVMMQNERKAKPLPRHLACNSALFAFTVGVGYLLMLVAMTYHLGLIFAVLCGLGVGHFVFSYLAAEDLAKTGVFYQPITEQCEPCCGEI